MPTSEKYGYHGLIRITEEEMWQLEHGNGVPRTEGKGDVPTCYCVKRSGELRFFPPCDMTQVVLMCRLGPI